ncbi:MAG: hypothetical protein JXR49_14465 [Acidobacteria bacterium]|nr:hypothetical protein [Acidobacteriota bacterium]
MLLNSNFEITNQQAIHPKDAAAGKTKSSSFSSEVEKASSKTVDNVRIPASEATIEAAAKAKGMKKIELEIAAAAGLLRPISPEPPPESKQYSQSLDDLLRSIDELKNPRKSPDLDLFE